METRTTAVAVPVLASRDLMRTWNFYRYFGFELVETAEEELELDAKPSFLRLRKEHVEISFAYSELDYTSPELIRHQSMCIIRVTDVEEWHASFANSRIGWKAMYPSLTNISDAAWGSEAFALTDRDGNLIWIVHDV